MRKPRGPAAATGARADTRLAPPRVWELDALRGLLVIAMAAYHSFFCASYLGLSAIDPYTGFLGASPLFIAGGFILVSGISMGLGYGAGRGGSFGRVLRRSLKIGACALAFTVVTLIAVGRESFVAFGVLHCLALAGIIAYPFRKAGWINALLGLAIVVPGFLFLHGRAFPVSAWPYFFLGFRPEGYYPLDFVPLSPWAGFAFLGLFAASLLYRDGTRRYPWPFSGRGAPARALAFIGRKSLLIYVVHVPLILGFLMLVKLILRK